MIIKQIKLTNVSKDRLGRLKGKTGIKNWNVLLLMHYDNCYYLYIRTLRLTAISSETGMFHPLLPSESDSDPR